MRASPARLVLAALWCLWTAAALHGQVTFYEAYEQGLGHEKAGRWTEARQSFLLAVELRPKSGTRIKTYGLNFLDRYEPYLHLAEVELELGRLDEAEGHLATARLQGVAGEAAMARLEESLRAKRAAAAPPPPPSTPPPSPPPEPVPAQPVTAEPPVAAPPPPETETAAPVVQEPPMVKKPAAADDRKSPSPPPPSPPPRSEPEVKPAEATAGDPAADASPPAQTDEATAEPPAPAVTPPPPPTAPEGEEASRSGWLIGAGVAVVLLALVVALASRRRAAPADAPAVTFEDSRTERLDRTPTPLPRGTPTDFGEYQLAGLLGMGGMARTYLATRRRDGLQAAIKVPHEHLLANAENAARFLREGQLGATLHHPNIVRIYEAAERDGTPFIAMEYLRGETLEVLLGRERRLALRRALEIARGIALALDYAHLKGVVHRDLKPDNIMVVGADQVKVMDYGIARVLGTPGVTATGTYIGTPFYSAPESLAPEGTGPRSDLYSLGIILYQMLAGDVPFHAADPVRLLLMHQSEPLPDFPAELALPDDVVGLVRRLTAKLPDERPESAEAVLQELGRVLTQM